MNQLYKDKLILLGIPCDEIYHEFCGVLQAHHFRIMRATTIPAAIQKIIEFTPDLIICNNDFLEFDAYHAYNLLRRTTLNLVAPYIVYVENYDADEIIMGLELGIDNFIFSPVNEKRIIPKLKLLFEKIDKYKAPERTTFEKLFVASPISMLVCESKRIERANPAFYNSFGLNRKDNLPELKEIFDFSNTSEHEKEFCKCLKGLTNDCVIRDVLLKGKNKCRANLYISNISHFAINRMLVQIEILSGVPEEIPNSNITMNNTDDKKDRGNDYVLTTREYDILKISGKGTPIKLIASELGISQRTVEKHRSNIMRKTDSTNIIEAIGKVYGISKNLVD